MSESDGKNESQLLDWADLKGYLQAFVVNQVKSPAMNTDLTTVSLITWLLWMTISPTTIPRNRPEYTEKVLRFLHPFVVAGYQAPSIYGPDSYFYLPLSENFKNMHSHFSGRPPPRTEIILYSHKLVLAAPIVTSAATLLTTAYTEVLQDSGTFPAAAYSLPPDRAAANTLNFVGPTLDDVLCFHFHERIWTPVRCIPALGTSFDGDPDEDEEIIREGTTLCGSERYDEDWTRIVACHDPQAEPSPLRGKVFTPGSLAGPWKGRLLLPEFDAYANAVADHCLPLESVTLYHKPLYWTLREHHCLVPNEPLNAGMDDMGDEDFLNAWLPRGIKIKYVEGAMEVFDPNTSLHARYETFVPHASYPYSRSAGEKLSKLWIPKSEESEDELSSPQANFYGHTAYIDDDEEYEDVVFHQSSGVCDIIVTGEVDERHGESWGHFTIVGRVRPWDGLVVLLRSPRDPTQTGLGEWLFKGYIHDQNLVGRWRERFTTTGGTGFEGGFVVCKDV